MAMFQFDGPTGSHFEDAVRQVARNLFPSSVATGSTIIDGRERDEVIDTGTEIIVFEATKEQKVAKTQYDYQKSYDLIKKFRSDKNFDGYNFRIMLVTQEEPTPHQKDFIKNAKRICPVEIISFSTFYSKLFDARNYLRLRDNHFFGSIRNPADEADLSVAPGDYIPTRS